MHCASISRAIYCTAQLFAQVCKTRRILLRSEILEMKTNARACLERVNHNVPKSLILKGWPTETYYAIVRGTYTHGSVHRFATDVENLEKSGNLKETSESQGICLKSQGICDRIPKVREKSGNFVVWNSLLAKLKILILKIFWVSVPPDSPKWTQTHGRALS